MATVDGLFHDACASIWTPTPKPKLAKGPLNSRSGAHGSQTASAERMLVWVPFPVNVGLAVCVAAAARPGRRPANNTTKNPTTDRTASRLRKLAPRIGTVLSGGATTR